MRDHQSEVRVLLAAGRVGAVAALVGTPFTIRGLVVAGDRRGRTIGFPTANLAPKPDDPCPAVGGYAGIALDRPAAINVGVRPTFDASDQLRVEVHVLDFTGDLYGTELTVSFLARIREERRFAGPDALAEQVQRELRGASVTARLEPARSGRSRATATARG